MREFEGTLSLKINEDVFQGLDVAIKDEIQSWLEDLGFEVVVNIKEGISKGDKK